MSGGGGRLILTALANIVVALGVVSLVIFPPIAAKMVNGYVAMRPGGSMPDAARQRVAGDAPKAACS